MAKKSKKKSFGAVAEKEYKTKDSHLCGSVVIQSTAKKKKKKKDLKCVSHEHHAYFSTLNQSYYCFRRHRHQIFKLLESLRVANTSLKFSFLLCLPDILPWLGQKEREVGLSPTDVSYLQLLF